MSYSLSKNFRFESAHRLAKGYKGKCAHIHGHSWNGSIAIECNGLDEFDMGVDYGELGKFVKAMEAMLDHKLWLHDEDEDLIQMCEIQGLSIVKFEHNPTSETLARYIFEQATCYFKQLIDEGKATIKYVKVEETCTTSCKYTG